MSRCGCSEKVYRVRENPAFIDLLEHLFFLSPQKWRITQASGFIFLATMKWLILRFSNRRTLTDAGQYVSKFCRISYSFISEFQPMRGKAFCCRYTSHRVRR
jgi:hypothetical protein